jgi:hypothetical protein
VRAWAIDAQPLIVEQALAAVSLHQDREPLRDSIEHWLAHARTSLKVCGWSASTRTTRVRPPVGRLWSADEAIFERGW